MVKPRILSAWTPSKRRVREDLEMHLEEAEQQNFSATPSHGGAARRVVLDLSVPHPDLGRDAPMYRDEF